jgi:hypothetical protein
MYHSDTMEFREQALVRKTNKTCQTLYFLFQKKTPVKMKARPAAEAEKLIDKYDIIGNFAVDRSRQISGHRNDKNRIYAAKELNKILNIANS